MFTFNTITVVKSIVQWLIVDFLIADFMRPYPMFMPVICGDLVAKSVSFGQYLSH